ncbi:MAG: phosphatase PAP2 family protein [Saccharofermentanales bacterium]
MMSAFFHDYAYFVPISILSVMFILLDIFYLQLERFNIWVRHIVNKTRQVKIKKFMIFTHQYNDFIPTSTQILLVAMLLGFLWKDWKSGLFMTAALMLQTTVVTVTKTIAVRTRPPHIAAHKLMTSGSYPSGHSASTMAMALIVPTYLYPYLPMPAIIGIFVYLLVNALFTAYGRLYLDMHWATDILGGWILSIITYLSSTYLIRL